MKPDIERMVYVILRWNRWSLPDLAEKLGCPTETLQTWCNENRCECVATASAILHLFKETGQREAVWFIKTLEQWSCSDDQIARGVEVVPATITKWREGVNGITVGHHSSLECFFQQVIVERTCFPLQHLCPRFEFVCPRPGKTPSSASGAAAALRCASNTSPEIWGRGSCILVTVVVPFDHPSPAVKKGIRLTRTSHAKQRVRCSTDGHLRKRVEHGR
jgi:hypothetical protein